MSAPSTGHQCQVRRILEGRFHADLRVYVDCAINLGNRTGTPFEDAYRHAEGARIAFERSRLAFNKHIAEHGC
jgi:hypothetical protein